MTFPPVRKLQKFWPHFLADEVVRLAQHVSPVRVPQQDPVAADACGRALRVMWAPGKNDEGWSDEWIARINLMILNLIGIIT